MGKKRRLEEYVFFFLCCVVVVVRGGGGGNYEGGPRDILTESSNRITCVVRTSGLLG